MAFLSVPLLAVLSVCCLAVYRFFIYPTFISPLSKIPNAHWTAPFSPLWILWTRYSSRENRVLHAAHLKLGPIVRVAPNEISINDVAGLRTVYAGGFEKGEWYSIFDNYGVPCMFSEWHSRTHSARKRMISNTYSKSNIHNSAALAAQAQAILYGRLLPAVDSADVKGIDVHDLWFATTMDGMTAYQFGLKNGSNFLQDVAYRRHWLDLYQGRKGSTFFTQELPQFLKYCKKIGIKLVPKWVDDANQELEDWTQMLCDNAMAYMKSSAATDKDVANDPVVLNALISGIGKEKKMKGEESVLASTALKYERLSIASEMIDHVAAGHETSGITLTYLSWQLSRDIPLQDKLRAELLGLKPNMLMSNSQPQIPSSKDLDALPLLHAVLMETLRLHAPIPGNEPRITPYPSCTLGGYTVPGGVRVGAQAHSVHRNSEVYPDPETFDYTRWLDDENGYSEEQRKERDRWFWAFSSGGRMCVGSNFAMHGENPLLPQKLS
ncbi:Cytochrome P450 [Hyphodiscus hymeniophilus]|uniref:Cytochrome P450 n=1 Tax=Hyphodiscus hymeniophilus TaxID=353542 RepID=A0A9P6VJ08_9HELO|nr:Cytochrome P450 [Hyphodiscus hymeniophilus]